MRLRFGWFLTLAIAAGSALAGDGALAQIAYEGFNASFPAYAAGGTGFDGPWTQGGFNVGAADYAPVRRSLRFRGMRGTGGSIAGFASASINGMVRTLRQPLGQNGTIVYLGFLLRPLGTLDDGVFGGFFGMTLGNDLFVGRAGNVDEYVVETRGGGGRLFSAVPTVVGRTALLVVKVEFLDGTDRITLFVDPKPRGAEPGGGVVKTDLDLGVVSSLGVYSGGAFAIDEIRLGATFAESLGVQ
jgi:hypothetical protein